MHSETAEIPIEGRYTPTGRVTIYDLGPVELHLALDRQLERQVAVLLLPASASADDRALFLERQRIAAGIHHCGVVQVYDVGEWHGAHFSIIEKDAASHGGPTPAHDGESALSTSRQVAEALQCVRDAGLTSWVFTPAALRTGADGAPRLALLEGLQHDARYATARSARPEDDGRALGTLLAMLIAGLPLAAIPAGVHDLMERSSGTQDGATLTAGDFAAEIARIEREARQLTVAYAEARDNAPAPTPYLAAGTIDPNEAPTLAAPVVPAVAPAPLPAPAQPYEGPPPVSAAHIARTRSEPRRRALPLLPVAAAGLLLLLVLLFVAWPRGTTPTELAGTAASAPEVTPTSLPAAEAAAPTAAPTAVLLPAPDFLGKTLPEAKALASASGIGLLIASAAHDTQYAADTISRQDPAAGTPLAPGSEVSLVMSLGPEPQVEQPPPPHSEGGDEDNNGNNDKEKDNGKDKKKP